MDRFTTVIEQLILKKNLSQEEASSAMRDILSGTVAPAQIASFLTALRVKGESADEIAGFAKAMRESMVKISSQSDIIADTCGTGGDGKGTFNISTAASFVVAGAGIKVAKHGNRSVSSRCGSADVLESLGVKIDMSKETAEKCLNEVGMTFLFAPLYHPSMKIVAPVRKELGIRTVFNLLGPLVNPAGANVQILGVPRKEQIKLMANVLRTLNRDKDYSGVVVHERGYDELVLSGKAFAAEVGKKVRFFSLTPSAFGVKKVMPGAIHGGNMNENGLLLREILSGKETPLSNVVCANAALLLFSAGKMRKGAGLNVPGDLKGAFKMAQESLSSGAARRKLSELAECSQSQ